MRRRVDAAADRFAAMGRMPRTLILIILGIAAATGQAPLGWWPVSVAAFAVWLVVAAPVATRWAALGAGWWFGIGYFGFALRWIVSPFMVDPARDGWMAPFAVVLMAAGGGLFWGLSRVLAHWIAPRNPAMVMLALVLSEVARALIFTGFPWASIGHIWVGTPLAQLAAFGGPHLLSLVTAALAWSLVMLAYPPRWAALVPALAVAGWLVLNPGVAPVPDGPVVRLVQPNAPQDEKWDPDKSYLFFDRMLASTGAGDVPALVVWPETAIPTLLEWAQPSLDEISDAARGAPVIVGINRRDAGRYYNSMLLLGHGGDVTGRYDKQHLVPFGEYIPFGEWFAQFGIQGLAASQGGGFTAGHSDAHVTVPGIGDALPLICYEGVFSEEIDTFTVRPRVMLLITNDAWFGPAAGPLQHLAQAQLRAIEQGVPMVRVANTGVSAMIDGKGRITAQLGMGRDGFIDAPLPPVLPVTIYARFGDVPIFIILAFLCVLSLILGRNRYT